MLRFFPYVLKTLWGHRTRSLLTLSGAAVALFVFAFVGGIQEGMKGLSKNKDSDRSLIVFQIYRFCPETSRLPEDYGKTIAKIPGVADVLPTKVFMNNCGATLDLIVFHGIPPQKLREFRKLTLLSGDFSVFERQRDAALVGRTVAARRGLKAGDKFTVGEVTVSVVGIFSSPVPVEENMIYAHLEFIQYTRGLNSVGMVTQFEVKVADGTDPTTVARAIDAAFRADRVQTDTRGKGVFEAFAVGDLSEMIGFTNYLGYACVILVLTLVSTTTMMAVQDRVQEHAVLQTLGLTSLRIFGLVLIESMILSIAGGLVGVGGALAVLQWGRLAVATEGINITFAASPTLAALGLGVSLIVGMLAGFMPAMQAARADIVTSLRGA
jgi:putative ABC transport system permease protein